MSLEGIFYGFPIYCCMSYIHCFVAIQEKRTSANALPQQIPAKRWMSLNIILSQVHIESQGKLHINIRKVGKLTISRFNTLRRMSWSLHRERVEP